MQLDKNSQHQIYSAEPSNLSSQPSSSQRITLVCQLRLFIDRDGLLKYGGRIHNAPLSQLAEFPYLLPPKHPFTVLVVYAVHVKLYQLRSWKHSYSLMPVLLDTNSQTVREITSPLMHSLQEAFRQTIRTSWPRSIAENWNAGCTPLLGNCGWLHWSPICPPQRWGN